MSKEDNRIPLPAGTSIASNEGVMAAWVEMMKHGQVAVWLEMTSEEIDRARQRVIQGKPPGKGRKHIANYLRAVEALLSNNNSGDKLPE